MNGCNYDLLFCTLGVYEGYDFSLFDIHGARDHASMV